MPAHAVPGVLGHLAIVALVGASGVIGRPPWGTVHVDALFWAPSAAALGAVLVYGSRALISVVPGLIAAHLIAGTVPLAGALAVAVTVGGQALGVAVGAWLTEQVARGPRAFERAAHVGAFVVAGAAVCATFSAGGAVLAATLASVDVGAPVDQAGLVWWWSELTALVTLAPAFTLWMQRPRLALSRRRGDRRPPERGLAAWTHPRAREGWALALVTVGSAAVIFGPWLPPGARLVIALLVPFPLLSWPALRFGARETATVVATLAIAKSWSLTLGSGLFETLSPTTLAQQVTMMGPALTALIIAAAIDRRNRQDSELHLLAVTDPLTGLANYRHLTNSIDRQIRRTRQTGEPFALLLLDVDNLKVINDQMGHNVGSRLLVRLSDALRASCRVTDLIARYGGDEFAVLLPGCDEPAARIQAARVQAAMDADAATPRISASMGVAVFPRDGDTADQLLDRADDELYAMKGRNKPSRRARPGA